MIAFLRRLLIGWLFFAAAFFTATVYVWVRCLFEEGL